MRRLLLTATALLLLGGASLAVAHGLKSHSLKQVSATFTATTATKVRTASCTGADGTYERTRATYTGTSTSSEPTLNGPLRIEVESLVNTTTGIGVVSGRFAVGGGWTRTHAGFDAVLTGTALAGLAKGGNHGRPHAGLVGNVSAAFSTAGGFTDGKLGGGTTGGNAVMILRGGCKPGHAPKPEKVEARGAITAISTSPPSITVAGITCSVPADLQSKVSGLQVGQSVKIKCTVAGGVNTLVDIDRR
jgi:hypothetical protein